MRELKVSAIREGTVIDHIPAENAFKVVDILDLEGHDNIVSLVTNLPSKKLGKKGIVKVGGKSLTEAEVNKISIVAPNATINIIKDYKVKKKETVKIPEEFNTVVKCSNPKCITNAEKVKTRFTVESKEPLKVRCHYCERTMKSPNIELL
ncbi:aspartate carbamoyltransferase regulatory subunit [Candidatus Woesearchaeota archaeon]|nr:aspartate carbamoyltransferase regulatory subunit [Candidatus Woesearchaeota archaeon]